MNLKQLQTVQIIRRYTIILSIVLVCVALVLFKPMDTQDTYFHFWMEASGILLILSALAIRLWCSLYIGGRKNAQIMMDGPYSIVRNPLYVGSVVGATGVGLQTGMLTFGVLGGLICGTIFSFVVRKEESFLEGTFGKAYVSYCQRVPRFIPNFSLYTNGATRYEFDPSALWRTLRDGLVFLLAIPLTEFIEIMHEMGNLPVLMTLL